MYKKFIAVLLAVASYKVLEVYGLENPYTPAQYNETMQYSALTGNLFRMGYPGVG